MVCPVSPCSQGVLQVLQCASAGKGNREQETDCPQPEEIGWRQPEKTWCINAGQVHQLDCDAGKNAQRTDDNGRLDGFVFSDKGLMFNLTLEGPRFTRLEK